MVSCVFILFWISWTSLPSVYLWGSIYLNCLPNFLLVCLCSLCWLLSCLYILNTVLWYIIYEYFLLIWGLPFHSIDCVFHREQFFNIDEGQFINLFLLCIMLLVSYLGIFCLTQGHNDFFLMFSFKVLSFILYLDLWSILVSPFSFCFLKYILLREKMAAR